MIRVNGEAAASNPTVTIAAGTSPVTEGTAATFTVTASPQPTTNLSVNLSVADVDGSDFVASGDEGAKTVTINANTTSVTHTVPTVDDSTDENNGDVTVTLAAGTGYTVGSANSASVTVEDNDVTDTAPSFSSAAVVGDKLTITFNEALAAASNLSNDAFGVKKTPSGGSEATVNLSTSTAPAISGSTVVLTLATAVVPTDGSIKVSYTRPATDNSNRIEDAAGLETDSFTDQAVTNNTVPILTIAAGTSPVTEGADATFTITAHAASASNITVKLTVADVTGSDFVASGNEGDQTVTLNANTTSVTHTVPTVDDSTDENNGDVTVTLAAGTGYTVGSANSASVTVEDNDVTDTAPSFSSAAVVGDKLTITFNEALAAAANLSNDAFEVKKTPASSGTETDVDLHGTTGPSISGSTVVLTLANAVVPTDTSIKVSYTKPGTGTDNRIEDAAGLETDSFTDQAVTNNTLPTITIAAGTSPVTEGTNATFTVTSNAAAPSAGLTVRLSVSESSNGDYVAAGDEGSKTVTISSGDTTATYSVTTQDDSVDETNGSVTVTVSSGTGYAVGSPASASVAVNDNDEAADSAPDFGTATVANQSYMLNTAITDLVLPAATGGDGALSYTLTPALPAGLSFTASTRTLSGTPTAGQAAATYTYKVTDADTNTDDSDADTLTFTIAVTYGCAGSTAVGGSTVTTGGLVDDCETLLSSEATLVGAGTTLNWDPGTAMASWDGVTVSDSRVTVLNLGGRSLAGSIPAALGNLENLTELWLGVNSLTGSIPAALGNLENLTQLRMGGNSLTGSIPKELGNLENLTHLTLSLNPMLAGTIPKELGNLSNLTSLALWGTSVTGSIPKELGNLENLTLFNLQSNLLTGSIPKELDNLASVNNVLLDGNLLTGCIPASLRELVGTINPQKNNVNLPVCPGVPVLTLTAGDTEIAASWTAPAGGTPTGYDLEYKLSSATGWTDASHTGTGTAATIESLTNDSQYNVRVRAKTATDTGDWSETKNATPTVAAPVFFSASVNGDKLTITFNKALAAAANLDNSAFAVKKTPSGGSATDVDLHATTMPSISGRTVVLTLATAVVPTDGSIKVSYTKPTTGADNRIKDADNRETDSFSDQAVTNNTVVVPTITIAAGTSPVTEGTAASFTVTASPAPGANLTVKLTVADVSGSDFVAAGNEGAKTVTINANETTATYSVATVADTTDEESGDITVTVATGTGYTVGTNSSATVRVNDDDVPSHTTAPDFGTATVANQSYMLNTAITDLVLPAATGGDGALSYTLTPALPAGLTFTASTRTLSGTPTAGQAAATYTYKVTDEDSNTDDSDADTLTFTIAVTYICAGSTAVGGSTVTTGGLVDDCETLLSSEATLVGAGTTLNWDPGTAMASWDGVTVSDSRVTVLNLSGPSLSGSIPAELGNLENLTQLFLSSTSLSGSIPAELGNLENLTQLFLSSTSLTGSIPAALGNLENLTQLWLGGNSLTGSIPKELGNLENLTHLTLSLNPMLAGTIPKELGNLSNLTSLALWGTSVTGSIPKELGNLENLTLFNLQSNLLTGSIPKELDNLASVNNVLLDGNLLTGCIPASLRELVGTINPQKNNVNLPVCPGVPVLTLTAGDTEIAASWTAPAGGTPTGYDLEYKLSTATGWTDASHTGTGTAATIESLTNGTQYNVRVRAKTATDTGDWSETKNATPAEAAPSVSSASVTGDKLTITFNKALAAAANLSNDAFEVKKTPASGTEDDVDLHATTMPSISGSTVVLTLATAVDPTDGSIKVSYTKPTTGTDNRIKDAANRETDSFSDQAVTNNTGTDTAPSFSSAAVVGDKLTITFNEALAAAANLSNDAFGVKKTPASGTETDVDLHGTTGPSISGSTVVLTLATAVVPTDGSIKVSYTKPTSDNSNRIEDDAGLETDSFTDQAVTNNTLPTITIAAGTSPVTEGTAATFTVTSNAAAPSAGLTVNLTVSESSDGDYVASGDEGDKTVTISSGETTATHSVSTVGDTTDETNGSVTVTVKTGTGYTVGSDSAATVNVNDDDEPPNSAPVFTSQPTTATVDENSADGTKVKTGDPAVDLTVTATDADSGDTISYSLDTAAAKLFAIDSSGNITVDVADDAALDHEALGGSIIVTVTATDSSSATAEHDVTITIADQLEAPDAPGEPTVAAASSTSLSVSWTAPDNDGKPDISGYVVEYRASGDTAWIDHSFTGTGTSTTISGLSPGTTYEVQVQATNDEGGSDFSTAGSGATSANSAPVFTSQPTTGTVPENSADNTAVKTGTPAANLTVTATDADAADTITYSLDTEAAKLFAISSSGAITVDVASGSALDHEGSGGSITATVTATDTHGATAEHDVTITIADQLEPPAAPGEPTVAAASSTSVTVSWTAPANAGKPDINGYDVEYKLSTATTWTAHSFTGTGISTTISGLSPGTTYNVQVRAKNAEGDGDWSPSGSGATSANVAPVFTSQPTTAMVAENSDDDTAPQTGTPADDLTVTATDANAADTITYTLDTAAAKLFAIDSSGAITVDVASDSALDHEALGGSITATVTATDTHGATATHNVAITVTDKLEPPDAPGAPTVTGASTSSLSVSWTAPDNDGKPAINDYDVRYRFSTTTINNPWLDHSFDDATTSTTINVPDASRSYDVRVKAKNAEGESGWSDTGSGSTLDLTITIAAGTSPVTEGTAATFTVTASPAVHRDLVVPLSISEKAGSDFVAAADEGPVGVVTIASGATSATYSVATVADTTDEPDGSVTVTVAGSNDYTLGATTSATVAVNDDDDPPANPPVFTDQPTTATVAENSANDTAVMTTDDTPVALTITATDADGDTLSYSLDSDSAAVFTIDSDGAITVQLQGTATLDHETKSSYPVTVVASDGTGTASHLVTVSVTDELEPPEAPDTPTVTSASATSVTVNWTAPDNEGRPDIDDYNVQYRVSGATAWIAHSFTGAETSTTIAGLTASTTYEVQVQASNDEGASAFSTAGSGATGEADNIAPTFTSPPASLDIAEDSAAGTVVGTVAATDADAGDTLTYSLNSTLFGISASGVITVASAGALDYESAPSLTVIVTVNDGTVDVTHSLTISVTDAVEPPDAPDAPTVTAASPTSLSVSWTVDNTGKPAITDYDVRYKLSAETEWTDHPFIGTGTGTAIAGLTPEAAYDVQVQAFNADGASGWSATGSGDTSANNAPVFTDQAATASVAENSADDTPVVTITATDEDSGDTIAYSLDSASDALFDIDPFSGAITVQVDEGSALDHEAAPSITATVTATDSNDGAATHEVTISVTDELEPPDAPAAPAVAGASQTSVTVTWTAPENAGRPDITDYDVRYRLSTATGWTDHAFTGTETSTTIPDLTSGSSYQVQVQATNAEGDSDWSATGSGATNSPDNSAPAFTAPPASLDIAENSAARAIVGTVAATDADADDTLTYSLDSASDALFNIDASGVITVGSGAALDHEATPEYAAVVTVNDGTVDVTHSLTINVTDEDEPPATPGAPSVTAASATSVTVTWTAPDNAGRPDITGYDVRYRLSTATDWTAHAVTETETSTTITGLTAGTTYEVQVMAKNDEGDSDWSATGSGATAADSPDNNPPTFTSPPDSLDIAEDSAAGTVVGTVAATDPDDGDTLTYSLDSTLFNISSSGVITVASGAALDYESAPSLTVIVTVNDGTVDVTHNLTINVTDAVEPPDPGPVPVVEESNVSGSTVTLEFESNLDTTSVPEPEDFTVTVTDASAASAVASRTPGAAPAPLEEHRVTAVAIRGSLLELTISPPVGPDQTVTVSYTAGERPLRTADGAEVADFTVTPTNETPAKQPPANLAPAADAGADATAAGGASVTLDGSASSDPDGDALTHSWTQTAGASVTLSGADMAQASFTAPDEPGALTFRLTVTDPGGLTAEDTVTVTVSDDVPDFGGATVAALALEQGRAVDPQVLPAATGGNGALSYSLTSSPAGLAGLAFDPATRTLSGTAGAAGSYTFTYRAEDGDANRADADAASLTFRVTVSAGEDRKRVLTHALAGMGQQLLSNALDNIGARFDEPADTNSVTVGGQSLASLGLLPGGRGFRANRLTWSGGPNRPAFGMRPNGGFGIAADGTGGAYGGGMDGDPGGAYGGGNGSAYGGGTSGAYSSGTSGAYGSDPSGAYGSGGGGAYGGGMSAPYGDPYGSGPNGAYGGGMDDACRSAAPDPQTFSSGGAPGAANCGAASRSIALGGSPDQLLQASAFSWRLGAAANGKPQGPRWSVWGRGDLGMFQGRPDAGSGYDGDMRTGWLGVDARTGPWVAGVALSRATGEADYHAGSGAGSAQRGRLEIELTALYPYARWSFGNGIEMQAVLGAGSGDARHFTGRDAPEDADLKMRLGSLGVRGPMAELAGLNINARADLGFVRMETGDGEDAVHGLTADAWRARFGFEASRQIELAPLCELVPFLEVAGRQDSGDGLEGAGVEVAGGVRFSNGDRFQLEARGRVLALHSADGAKERGVSLTARLAPRADGGGLTLALTPRWGASASPTEALWRHEMPHVAGHAGAETAVLGAQAGYGFVLPSGLLTSFTEADLAGADYRVLRAGVRYEAAGSRLQTEFLVERHESLNAPTDHGLRLNLGLGF